MATSTKTNLTLRIDSDVKANATRILNALGMSLNTATDIFYRQVIQHSGLPFSVKLDEEPNKETYTALEESEQMIKNPNLYEESYDNFSDMAKDILNED